MITISDRVEITYEFDRYSDKDVAEATQAFSYVCRNTNVDVNLTPGRMTISGDVGSVATVHKRTKEYFTKAKTNRVYKIPKLRLGFVIHLRNI